MAWLVSRRSKNSALTYLSVQVKQEVAACRSELKRRARTIVLSDKNLFRIFDPVDPEAPANPNPKWRKADPKTISIRIAAMKRADLFLHAPVGDNVSNLPIIFRSHR